MKRKQTAAPAAVSAPAVTDKPVTAVVTDAAADAARVAAEAEALALAELQAAEAKAAEDKAAAEAKAAEDEAIARSQAAAMAESDARAAADAADAERLKGYSGDELKFPLTLTIRNNGPIPLSEPATHAYLHAGGASDVTIHDAEHLTLLRQNLDELAALNYIDPALLVIDGLPS